MSYVFAFQSDIEVCTSSYNRNLYYLDGISENILKVNVMQCSSSFLLLKVLILFTLRSRLSSDRRTREFVEHDVGIYGPCTFITGLAVGH